jgi:hypothetical protein
MKRIIFTFFILGAVTGVVVYKALEYHNFEIPHPVATLPDGAVYEGDMVDGVIEGEGRMLWSNGHRYEGSFKNGLFHGHGRYETPYGWSYEGEFTEGDLTGTGTLIYSEDQKYTGELKYGRANGKGIQEAWGNVYEGEFIDDKFHGTGTLTSWDGDVYTGEFKDNQFHGKGIYTTIDNRIYSGEFVEGAFTGQGTYTSNDGEEYGGGFDNWTYHGKGSLKDENGDRFTGTFDQGSLTGEGEHIAKNGAHYEGEFKHGLYHGKGKLKTAEGDIYEGKFRYGQYHGKGTLTYAEPLDGISIIKGKWKNGELVDADDKSLVIKPALNNEISLYNQHELLEKSWQQLQDNDPHNIDMYFLGIAGDGTEGVFRREILYVKNYFDRTFGTTGKSMALINSKQTINEIPLATKTSVKRSLEEIAKRMDAENDILFIYMTSHGSSEFEFVIKQTGMNLPYIHAKTLAETLKEIPVKWKVIVISACFSGGFIPELQDDHTLIITATSPDRQSFGCEDRNEFTYFGEAYFKDALPESENFIGAFDKALEIVAEREKAEDRKHSNPQIHKPKPILQHLEQWRAGLGR